MSEHDMHVEDAMDSKLAKVAVRAFIWLLPFVIGLFGWFITSQLGDIKRGQAKTDEKVIQIDEKVNKSIAGQEVLNAKLDTGVIWRITEIERRLNTVEQAQKTP